MIYKNWKIYRNSGSRKLADYTFKTVDKKLLGIGMKMISESMEIAKIQEELKEHVFEIYAPARTTPATGGATLLINPETKRQ